MPIDAKALLAKYQPKAGKPVEVPQQLCCVRFSPDGKTLVGGSFEGVVRRWDDKLAEMPSIPGHDGWVQCVAWSGDRLVSADTWGRLSCQGAWSVPNAHDGWIHALAVHGSTVASAGRDKTVRLSALADGKEVRRLDAKEDVMSLAFHPDGRSIVTGDLKGVVRQWDVATGKPVREFDAKVMFLRDRIQDVGGVRCFAWSGGAKTLFFGGCIPKTGGFVQGIPLILAVDWASGAVKQVYKGATDAEGYVTDLAWHPGGFLLATTSGQPGQGRLLFVHPDDPTPFFSAAIPNPHSLALHPEGKRIVVSATNANSAGNGRVKGKGSEYPGNTSPLHVFNLPI